MAPEQQILYLEPDDEITSVIRRLRETDATRLVLVAPGRTKATSSAVALRLLAAIAGEEGRELALVAEPLARSLAAEAGIPAFASVAEATVDGATPIEGSPVRRAAIHVVRPEASASAAPPPQPVAPAAIRPRRSGPGDETRAVPIARLPAPPARRRPARRRRNAVPLIGAAVLVAALLAAGGIAAAVLPAATIRIVPQAKPVGPVDYSVTPDVQHVSGEIPVSMSGSATGDHVERVTATGTVLFQSGNPGRCRIPAGTRVAAGEVVFATDETVVVPEGKFTGHGIQPGSQSVGITALEAGPGGNVAAGAIDTIEDANLTFCLRGFPNTTHRIVNNPAATADGAENHSPEITQADVDALVQRISAALTEQLDVELAKHTDLLVVAPAEPEKPTIKVPKGLVGKRGEETFELKGSLAYDRPAVSVADVDAAGREQLLADSGVVPAGTSLDRASIVVDPGPATVDGDAVTVSVSVSGEAVPGLDQAALRDRVEGLTPVEARATLATVGDAEVELWPGWVSRIPTIDWRVEIVVAATRQVGTQASSSP